jgi:hypothetical protein
LRLLALPDYRQRAAALQERLRLDVPAPLNCPLCGGRLEPMREDSDSWVGGCGQLVSRCESHDDFADFLVERIALCFRADVVAEVKIAPIGHRTRESDLAS